MTKCLAGIVVALAWLIAVPAQARTWQVDAAHSTLAFINSYQNVTYTGRFRRFTAQIDYDPDDLAHSRFDVIVGVASLDTRNGERDRAVLGADFLDATKFPRAHFVTTSFRKTANGAVIADGVLTLRGITRPATLAVAFAPHGNTATLDVTAQLQRLDFGIGSGQWADPSMIGNGVAVRGHLALTRTASAPMLRH